MDGDGRRSRTHIWLRSARFSAEAETFSAFVTRNYKNCFPSVKLYKLDTHKTNFWKYESVSAWLRRGTISNIYGGERKHFCKYFNLTTLILYILSFRWGDDYEARTVWFPKGEHEKYWEEYLSGTILFTTNPKLAWFWTRASAVRGQPITARAFAQPWIFFFLKRKVLETHAIHFCFQPSSPLKINVLRLAWRQAVLVLGQLVTREI
jgi:hypothetical protein